MADYNDIGKGYIATRRPDPRIAEQIRSALGSARSVVNVGAGTGAYEPTDIEVVAVEPSATMIAQRRPGDTRVVQSNAESLPFPDDSFDVALAVLTIHHWADWRKGIAEMQRVARQRIVIMTWDPAAAAHFWLNTYLPQLSKLDAQRFCPLEQLRDFIGQCCVTPVNIPIDCTDGFLCAYWGRPWSYLDPGIRRGISVFHLVRDKKEAREIEMGLANLADDLESGAWNARWGHLLKEKNQDLGYRLIVTDVTGSLLQ